MRHLKNPLLALAAVVVGLAIWAGCETAKTPAPGPGAGAGLKPGPNDPKIAYITARLLELYHYSQRPLDTELAGKFFDGYVDSLDPRHEHFFQSDLAEFAVYRTNLDGLTMGGHSAADLTPAFAVYERYLERFQQHSAYVNELLKQDKFKFNSDEKILLDRRHSPFPKNLDEAKQLWRQRLDYEYLQEKLSREISETNGAFTIKLPAGAATNITVTLAKHYRWDLHMKTNQDSDAVLQLYLNALAHAYDPHSDYMNAPRAQDFSMQMNLSLFGIGARLQEDDGYCTIKVLVAGGPAVKSKLIKAEDRIVAVAQAGNPPVDVVDMELEKVVQMIRGPKNTEVRLTISPADDRAARRVITLVRDEIKLEDSEAKAKLVEMPDGKRLGIIDLPSFYAPIPDLSGNSDRATPKYTSVDVAKLVKRLKKENISGLIIDLRINPGGSLEEAVKFTGLFIKGGPIVLARNPDGQVMVDSDPDPSQLYDGPLVVMVSRFSASASEIAAAALQDYGRALIVGDTSTHGKGTVQNLNPLRSLPFVWSVPISATNDPGAIKITIRKFYRVSGASTQFKGVIPDIILPDVLNYSTFVGESSLENPLPWDTIRPVKYDNLNLVQPYLGQLHASSDARLATNQDFLYIKQDIAQFQKFQLEKTAPLNEREAIKERERVATQKRERDNELLARPPSAIKVYDITLENADLPGLTEHVESPSTTDISFFINTNSIEAVAKVFDTNSLTQLTQTNLLALNFNPDLSGSSNTNPASVTNSTKVQSVKITDKKKSAPAVDPMLDEAERILEDYISLLSKNAVLMANH
jgi:carboxyl-terminal processing protease